MCCSRTALGWSIEMQLIVGVCTLHALQDHTDDSRLSLGRRRGTVVVSGVPRMNQVNARRARLVPGWVTVFG